MEGRYQVGGRNIQRWWKEDTNLVEGACKVDGRNIQSRWKEHAMEVEGTYKRASSKLCPHDANNLDCMTT